MERYADLNGDSVVFSFQAGSDYIAVLFSNGSAYEYDYARPGRECVERMKELARSGSGLNRYINQFVKDNYSHKIR